MSLNPIADIHSVYLEEVLKPQLGPKFQSSQKPQKSSSDLDGDGDVDSFEKKVRQFIYDVRHLMRKNNIPVERAFQMRAGKTNYGAEVIKTAKEKLGIKGGAPVSEENINEYAETKNTERLYKIVIKYKNGTTYRKRTSQSEINKLRNNPNVSSVEKTEYAPGLDYDGDGEVESSSKEHAGVVHNAIQRKTGGVPDGQDTRGKKKDLKSYGVKEEFSNWRQDLCEVVDEIKSKKKTEIKEDPSINNKVIITPNIEEQNCIIVDEVSLTEEYLNQVVEIATEYFYECGLNENGVDIVIEEIGENNFSEFVFELAEDYFITEELKKSESKVKTSKAPKGTKQYQTTNKRVAKQGGTKMTTASGSIGSTIRKDRVKKATEKAKETQAPSSEKSAEGTKKEVKKGILGHLKQSWQTAREVGREHERRVTNAAATVAGAVAGARKFGKKVEQSPEATRARRKATVAVGRKAQAAGKAAVKAAGAAGAAVGSGVAARRRGASAAGVAGAALGAGVRKLTREELELQEKAESEQQQKLFGLALSVKRGETPRSEASAEVLKIVDGMSEKKIRDFAKTPHSEVPKKKVNEAISNPEGATDKKSPLITRIQKEIGYKQIKNAQGKLGEDFDTSTMSNQELNLRKQRATIDDRIAELRKKTVRQQTAQKPQNTQNLQTQNASYEPKGELVDEAEQRIKKPAQYAKPRGTYDPTGIGMYPRSREEVKKMRSGQKVQPYPPLEKKQKNTADDENPPRRRYRDDHPSLTAQQRNPNLR